MSSREQQLTKKASVARCEEKIQLVANYGVAVARYYYAVSELERGMVTGSRELFDELRRSTEEARTMCETARKELDDHVLADGC
jgi:hypothetical protein